ncbi:hypothetical protein L3X38_038154 [Prunus dulcis]|uniref:Uncharacterized protein n=1 Tax=Prunus dulcis TaxID=3755 RepID=A0AAD4V607_PRUDU|nr:hypothetical protein L3X38_038154 [Prunus dulcis]
MRSRCDPSLSSKGEDTIRLLVADLCRRKEVHLHLRSPEKSITRAGIAHLLQKRDAQHLFDEMPKPPGLGPVT